MPRFQFSLRIAFVVLTSLGVGLGVVVGPAQQQRRAVKAIKSLEGFITYDWQREQPLSGAKGPAWLRNVIGDDYFQTVVEVGLFGSADEVRAAIPHLKRLESLKAIVVGIYVDGAALRDVERGLPNCKIIAAAG